MRRPRGVRVSVAQHLLPQVVRRRSRAEEAAAAEGGRGAGGVLQPRLPLPLEAGARVVVHRAVIEAEEAAHHAVDVAGSANAARWEGRGRRDSETLEIHTNLTIEAS